jgi:PKD repeat protein
MRRALVASLAILLMAVAYLPGCTIVKTENRAPISVFTANPKSINVGDTVFFSANESKDKDGKIIKYAWSFGDNEYSLEKWTSHVYRKGGNYTVDLIVTDDEGAVDRSNTTIHVNEWPFAEGRAGKDPAKVNDVLQFDGSESGDKDGKIVEYLWDFGDTTQLVTGRDPTHKYTKVGTYNVTLKVTDNDKASTTYDFKVKVIKRNYRVEWVQNTKVLDTISDYNRKNATMNKTLQVTTTNLTALVFNMTWKDLIPVVGPANDDFTLDTQAPYGDEKNVETTTEVIGERFNIGLVPETIQMQADSIGPVMAQISSKYTSQKGDGTWKMSIFLAPTNNTGIFNVTELLDQGNDWQIQITAYYYEADIIEIG